MLVISQTIKNPLNWRELHNWSQRWSGEWNTEKSVLVAARVDITSDVVTLASVCISATFETRRAFLSSGFKSRRADGIMTTIMKWQLTRKRNLLGHIIENETVSRHQAPLQPQKWPRFKKRRTRACASEIFTCEYERMTVVQEIEI